MSDGRVIGVTGDPDHPFTAGFLCGKVNHYEERVHSPDRLLWPLRRTGPKGSASFVRISWAEALHEIADRWQDVIAVHGSEALLGYVYSGNMGLVNRNLPRALFHALGASQFLPGTVCDTTCEAGWEYAVGSTPGVDPETAEESDLIICWGANVVSTNVHLLPYIDRARARGAKLVVIDPYRTRTAQRADWHLALRVGTDTALALGLMHILDRDGLCDADYLSQHAVGFERLKEEVLPHYIPERVAAITGVPAAEIERLAHLYGRARAPFLRIGMGMSRNRHGGMAVRTVACLPALVGSWSTRGGGALMETAAAFSFDMDAVRRPDLLERQTREINHSQLGRALTELSEPPIMALFVGANNPAVTCPDQARVQAGLAREDLFTVVHESFMTDTAALADIVLPATTGFESEDLFRSYGSYYVQYAPQVIPPQGEAKSNAELVGLLAEQLRLSDPVFTRSVKEHISALLAGASGPTAALRTDDLLNGGPRKLEGVPVGPLYTHFWSEAMEAAGLPALPEWSPLPAGEDRFPLRLLTAPGHFQHHTAFSGVATLQRRQGEPVCLLHPNDAEARGLADGDRVSIVSERGHVGLNLRVTDAAQPGIVVVEAQRSRSRYLSGGPLNVLTGDCLADMGGGATYQDTCVEVRAL